MKEKNFKLKLLFSQIHKHKLFKFLSVGSIMFSILFIYTMTRDLKIIFVQKFAINGGIELIPIIKLFFVFPAFFLFIAFFEFLINKFKSEKTFYIFITIFSVFYIVFSIFIFPNYRSLHMSSEKICFYQSKLPKFLHYFIPCIGNWSFVLFYILSEVWGSIVLPGLFWQFAHKITKREEAKRFFILYGFIGNIGVIFSGYLLKLVVNSFPNESDFKIQLFILMMFCVIFCLISVLTYYKTNKKFAADVEASITNKNQEKKVGIFKGIKILLKSKYMILISAILFGYGITEDFIELTWQNFLRNNLTTMQFSSTIANLSILIGIFTICVSFFSSFLINSLKWKTLSLITPIVMGSFGTIFFMTYLVQILSESFNIFGFPIKQTIIISGLLAVALARSVKYSIFESTRNMAYLPLDNHLRTRGQLIVESIGGKSGKSGSSIVNYILINLIYSGTKISKYLSLIFLIFLANIIVWIKSVFSLEKLYIKKIKENEENADL